MDSNLLKIFIEVANEKSISKAANKLGFAQSNVTSRIKQLENSIDTILFHRVPSGIILTKEGEKLYSYALDIVKKIDFAKYEMQNMKTQINLTIGSTESYASTKLINFLIQLNNDFPNINLELITNTTKETIKNLLEYRVDIAFISGNPNNNDLLILNKIDEEIVLAESKEKTPPNVLITFKNGCAYNDFSKNYLKNISNNDFKHFQFGNYETILACIKAGMGKSFLPISIIEKLNYKDKLKLTKLEGNSNIPTYLVCRKNFIPKIKEYLEKFDFN
ncbi:LysR family transcriptional regulator [Aliarcobacter thereius]|uniref:HTH-type transcriptional regulator GltR n=1 Tax=Aliarcobacter thereius LMG 24486 TaxID=1032240 RepID=A0A1C7WQZ3_9BACT|nr:LysR family transcriptional regulator [Aliarcobacter thereius]OCL90985.1 HTH-type transcriptional regulator GltR [Aliarcobacter thereius]OCL96186.1 HTH-type transcriptional regulator GltR [Aliarcobacter thereius LMG 24486]QBF15848.1 transcriptional regulator, LysR family [Aliarcobacter thereius LMG 24486]TLS94809.1 LysR family transcriptional regulator [Aliarcobacter thereius]HJE02860.1 LysR family transcriptional regulator [Aliarcobacter thereius]